MDYDYIKNHDRLIAVDVSRQKELDADPKTIQQIEFFGQLKNDDGVNADGTESIFSIIIMTNCQEVRVKLTNTQVNKLNSAAKINTGRILIINKRNFEDEDEELLHEDF